MFLKPSFFIVSLSFFLCPAMWFRSVHPSSCMSHQPPSTSSKSNGVQFMTKYEQLRHQEQNRLEFERVAGGGGQNATTAIGGAPVVVNMAETAVIDIPMETRARMGSSATSLKMHDDDEDDSDEEEEENAQEYRIRTQQAKK